MQADLLAFLGENFPWRNDYFLFITVLFFVLSQDDSVFKEWGSEVRGYVHASSRDSRIY